MSLFTETFSKTSHLRSIFHSVLSLHVFFENIFMHILIQIEAFCPFHSLPAHLHMYTHVLCVTVFINTLEIEGNSVSDGELCICI